MNIDPLHIVLYLLAINVITFFAFRHDKRAAKWNERRIPERSLLTLAFIGGSPAAYIAQRTLRHKTKKTSFRTTFFMIVIAQVLIGGYVCARYTLG